jgi:hypothetical protein
VSNNILAVLLVLAIIVSVLGIATISIYLPPPSLTGAVTAPGKVNLSITSGVELVLLRNESLFGSGYPNILLGGLLYIATNQSPSQNCGTLGAACFNNGSEGNGTNYGTGTYSYPFVARIGGNDPSTCLRIYAASSADEFIGGVQPSAPVFQFAGKQNESTLVGSPADSCYGGTLNSTWGIVMKTPTWTTVCDILNHTDSNDEVRIHWRLGIPEDAQGSKSNTITVCAAGDCGSC